MRHEWSSAQPVSCLFCSVARDSGNSEADCPKRPGAIRAKPLFIGDDLGDIGKRLAEIRKQEDEWLNRPAEPEVAGLSEYGAGYPARK